MARKPAKPQQVEQESESREAPKTESPVISKSGAARAAVDEGYESPQEAVAWIKQRFGIEMGAQHFSAIKSQYRKKAKARKAAVEGYLAPPRRKSANGNPDLLAAMESIKPLVASLGKEQVKRIVDLLG
jgi:hypothetical protein